MCVKTVNKANTHKHIHITSRHTYTEIWNYGEKCVCKIKTLKTDVCRNLL